MNYFSQICSVVEGGCLHIIFIGSFSKLFEQLKRIGPVIVHQILTLDYASFQTICLSNPKKSLRFQSGLGLQTMSERNWLREIW